MVDALAEGVVLIRQFDGAAEFSVATDGTAAETTLFAVVGIGGELLWLIAWAAALASDQADSMEAPLRDDHPLLVHYGRVPPGFIQLQPEDGAPPKLGAGRYTVFVSGHPSGYANFTTSERASP
jgi:hypothetical protein